MKEYLPSYYAAIGLIVFLPGTFESYISKVLIFSFTYWTMAFLAGKINKP